jgi:hypothetical protein
MIEYATQRIPNEHEKELIDAIFNNISHMLMGINGNIAVHILIKLLHLIDKNRPNYGNSNTDFDFPQYIKDYLEEFNQID